MNEYTKKNINYLNSFPITIICLKGEGWGNLNSSLFYNFRYNCRKKRFFFGFCAIFIETIFTLMTMKGVNIYLAASPHRKKATKINLPFLPTQCL